jgi:HTH-type transcriptional regulator / antitoxin HipB
MFLEKFTDRDYFGGIAEIVPIGNIMVTIKTSADFGREIRLRRKALGLTQQELAARCGVGPRFIVDLESGKPTSQLGKSLTVALEVGLSLQTQSQVGQADDPLLDPDDPLAHIPRF